MWRESLPGISCLIALYHLSLMRLKGVRAEGAQKEGLGQHLTSDKQSTPDLLLRLLAGTLSHKLFSTQPSILPNHQLSQQHWSQLPYSRGFLCL